MSKYEFQVNGERLVAAVERGAEGHAVTIDGKLFQVVRLSNDTLRIRDAEGNQVLGAAVWNKETCYVDIDGYQLEIQEQLQDGAGSASTEQLGAKDKIYAPMPGKIVKVLVAVGDEVQPKQPLVIVEAMKMENQVTAKASGRVKAVHFSAGDQVSTETPIIELELSE